RATVPALELREPIVQRERDVRRGARGLAVAHPLSVEDEHRAPASEEAIGRGEPRDARADDAHVGPERGWHRLQLEDPLTRPDGRTIRLRRRAHPHPPAGTVGWRSATVNPGGGPESGRRGDRR